MMPPPADEPADEQASRLEAPEKLRDIERARLHALVCRDLDRAGELHSDDFQLINPAGQSLSKDAYLGMVASGELRYLVWEPGEIAVRMYGEDAAVIRYTSVIEGVVSGQAIPRGRYWHTDTYERRGGRWQAVWSHATQTGED
jgi:hypothetical protein